MQVELGQVLVVNEMTVMNWETGRSIPDDRLVGKVSDV